MNKMTKHDGKKVSMEDTASVIVLLRSGGIKVGLVRKFIWSWYSSPYISDVVAYRVI